MLVVHLLFHQHLGQALFWAPYTYRLSYSLSNLIRKVLLCIASYRWGDWGREVMTCSTQHKEPKTQDFWSLSSSSSSRKVGIINYDPYFTGLLCRLDETTHVKHPAKGLEHSRLSILKTQSTNWAWSKLEGWSTHIVHQVCILAPGGPLFQFCITLFHECSVLFYRPYRRQHGNESFMLPIATAERLG